MLAQFTLMNGLRRRRLMKWMVTEMKLLLVPVSPGIKIVDSVWARRPMPAIVCCMVGLWRPDGLDRRRCPASAAGSRFRV